MKIKLKIKKKAIKAKEGGLNTQENEFSHHLQKTGNEDIIIERIG